MLHMHIKKQKHSKVPQMRQLVKGMYGKEKKYNKEKKEYCLKVILCKVVGTVNCIKRVNYNSRISARTFSNMCSFNLRLKLPILLLVLISITIEFQNLAALYFKNSWDCVDELR